MKRDEWRMATHSGTQPTLWPRPTGARFEIADFANVVGISILVQSDSSPRALCVEWNSSSFSPFFRI